MLSEYHQPNARSEVCDGLYHDPVHDPTAGEPAVRVLTIACTEWGIEHGVHHRRDVSLQENACQVWRGQAPQVLAALNNVVVGIVQQAGHRNLQTAQRAFTYAFDRILAQRSMAS